MTDILFDGFAAFSPCISNAHFHFMMHEALHRNRSAHMDTAKSGVRAKVLYDCLFRVRNAVIWKQFDCTQHSRLPQFAMRKCEHCGFSLRPPFSHFTHSNPSRWISLVHSPLSLGHMHIHRGTRATTKIHFQLPFSVWFPCRLTSRPAISFSNSAVCWASAFSAVAVSVRDSNWVIFCQSPTTIAGWAAKLNTANVTFEQDVHFDSGSHFVGMISRCGNVLIDVRRRQQQAAVLPNECRMPISACLGKFQITRSVLMLSPPPRLRNGFCQQYTDSTFDNPETRPWM